jgi:hypothetical protein
VAHLLVGLLTGSGSKDDLYRRNYSRVYRVRQDNLTDDEHTLQAFMATQGFVPNSPHPSDPGSRVVLITGQTVASYRDGEVKGLLWDVTVSYGPWNPLEHTADGDPTHQPVRFEIEQITVEVPLYAALDGNPIVNAAGDPFDPPLTDEVTEFLVTCYRNEETIDIFSLLSLTGKGQVNAAPWNGFPAKTVKVLPVKIPQAQWSQEGQKLYYPMVYQFHVRLEGWTRKVINQGMNELYTSGGTTKRRPIVDAYGAKVSDPALLDADGHALPYPVDSDSIVVLEFEIKEAIDFGLFNLDNLAA